jgi:hypothetical protein
MGRDSSLREATERQEEQFVSSCLPSPSHLTSMSSYEDDSVEESCAVAEVECGDSDKRFCIPWFRSNESYEVK